MTGLRWSVINAGILWDFWRKHTTKKGDGSSIIPHWYLVSGLEHFLFPHIFGNSHPNSLQAASCGEVRCWGLVRCALQFTSGGLSEFLPFLEIVIYLSCKILFRWCFLDLFGTCSFFSCFFHICLESSSQLNDIFFGRVAQPPSSEVRLGAWSPEGFSIVVWRGFVVEMTTGAMPGWRPQGIPIMGQ